MELPHCSAMWWQHSRSAGVIVAPGRTHTMAGVMAHNEAIVSSANARVLVSFISVLRFPTAKDEFSLQTKNVRSTWTTTAVTGITTLQRVWRATAKWSSTLTESLDEPVIFVKNTLTLEYVQGLILPVDTSYGAKQQFQGSSVWGSSRGSGG